MRITEYFKRHHLRRLLFASLLACFQTSALAAVELIMVEQNDCPYCEKFHHEIGQAYPKTDEGRTAPLRIVMLHEDWPGDLDQVEKATLTPTFILVEDNREVDRIVGYPGDEYFWFLLGELLDQLQP